MANTINVRVNRTQIRTRGTEMFINEARKYDLLSAEEELALIDRYQTSGDEKAKDALINHNLRFIYSLATKYAKGDEVTDLISCATIGMIRAMQDFDATKGFRFLSYAVHWMRTEISNYFIENSQVVRNKVGSRLSARASRIQNKFFVENGRFLTDEEIVDAINAELGKEIAKNGTDTRLHSISSLSMTIGEDEKTTIAESGEVAMMSASHNDYEDVIDKDDIKYNVARLLSTLSERDRTILELSSGMTDGIEKDDAQIGEILGYSSERIRQIRTGLYAKLRERTPMGIAM